MSVSHSCQKTNSKKSGEMISFGFSFEEYIREPAMLYRLKDNPVLTCSDKHVTFYVSADQPRHFRRQFPDADYAIVIHIALCHYLLDKDSFVLFENVDQFKDLSHVKAVLHFAPPPLTHKRIYLDYDTFCYLFSVSMHRVFDFRGRRIRLEYNEDNDIGIPFKIQVNQRRHRLSVRDVYLAEKFKSLPPSFVVVYEGRGWLSIIADAY